MDHAYLSYILVALFLYVTLSSLRVALKPGLRQIPGPFLARFTKLWRTWLVADGKAPFKYQQLHREYGPIVRSGPNTVEISDPAVIPTIYGINSKFRKTPFYSTMTPPYQGTLLPSMFSTQDPAYHKALKQPVASKFSMTSIRSFEPYADQCADIFIEEMRKRVGQAVNLSDWCQYYAFDVIGAITFQYRFGFMEQGRDVDNMMGSIWMALTYAGIIGQMPELHPWLVGNQLLVEFVSRLGLMPDNPMAKIMKITEDRMEAYEKADDRGDFMAWLREEQDKHPERMSERDLMNHLSNNLMAGSDTTAISLRAIFYFLIKNPSCYKKQMDEIEQADKAGLLSQHVTYEESQRLPYLQAVMKEALRMHPGIGFPLERFVPAGGTTVCGIELPEGTIVGVNPHVIHRNKEAFGDNADDFKPERWMEADPEQLKIMERSFVAFGYGVRTCIGKNISLMEMGKLVPQVLRTFELEWASAKEEWETHCYWMHKQAGMLVKFKEKN